MTTPHWEHFEHEADIGVRGFGNSLHEAFEQAAIAMTAIITDVSLVDAVETVEIKCEDDDPEILFTDWLNALIYEMATRKMLFSRFEVVINNSRLTGHASGEQIKIEKHQPTVEIKGATFTELAVYQQDNEYIAQCVVDV